jgi:hypothetical protein
MHLDTPFIVTSELPGRDTTPPFLSFAQKLPVIDDSLVSVEQNNVFRGCSPPAPASSCQPASRENPPTGKNSSGYSMIGRPSDNHVAKTSEPSMVALLVGARHNN